MDKRKRYGDKLNERIFLFKAKADKATAGTKITFNHITESFQRKNNQALTKLQGLRASGKETLKGIAKNANALWTEVRKAFHGTSSKFK